MRVPGPRWATPPRSVERDSEPGGSPAPGFFFARPNGFMPEKGEVMANHFTPEELSKDLGMETKDVIQFCLEEGIPIYKGKIDRSLLAVVMKAKGIVITEREATPV